MKLRAEVAGEGYSIELIPAGPAPGTVASDAGGEMTYSLTPENGAAENQPARTGRVSVREVMPGVISLIEGNRGSVVTLSTLPSKSPNKSSCGVVASIGGRDLPVVLGDLRDRAPRSRDARSMGPQEVRTLMPGKVVRILVARGDEVAAGQGVMIVEAMKMQNELKAPKAGRVTSVHVAEGSTAAAGETLLVIE
jgi:biotin carboxyl carrier protein